MKKFEEVKQKLQQKGVSFKGFGSWLYIQSRMEEMGIPFDDAPSRRYGMFADERKWYRVYPWLKERVDVKSFSFWLDGIRRPNDPFLSIGEKLAHIGRNLFPSLLLRNRKKAVLSH